MKIVIEYVFLENFFLNCFILKTVSFLVKEKCRRIWLSAFFSACFTIVMPLLNLSILGGILCEIGVMALMICLSFNFKTFKKFSKLLACCFLTLCLYGGVCFFFERLFGLMKTLLFLTVITSTYILIKIIAKWRDRKRSVDNFCFDVEICANGNTLKFKGFLDSGNMLVDPFTQKPVSLLNFRAFSRLFKDVEIEDIIRNTDKVKCLKFAHYINFNTLNNVDKILIFQVDKIVVGQDIRENQFVGLTLKNFNQAFGTDVILHNSFA